MAKKKGGGKGKGSSKKKSGASGEELKQENVLQAVLLADSFKTCFRPLTLKKPKVLMPLVNVPMINYTLEFLASGGVKEVFVLCCAHVEQVRSHLKDCSYGRMMKIHVVYCENSYSEGDALRHLEQMQVLKSDFVLIGGDVISNIEMKEVLDRHHALRKRDKLNIMTMVLKCAEPNHRTRGAADRAVVVYDKDTEQLLVFDNKADSWKTEVDVTLINEHPCVEFRHDLMDTHIYVCALDILDLLTENFDWQDLQRDLVKGVLDDFVLGNKIHAHIITGEYAARVQDPKSYHAISRDVIQRWTYPMVPEYNLVAATSYTVFRHNIYKEDGVQIPQSCTQTCDIVVGKGTEIGEGCILDKCIIGRNVKIGKGCELRRCHIYDDCQIGPDARVVSSVLGKGVRIGTRASVGPNCLLGPGVKVNGNRAVDEFARLCVEFDADEDDQTDLKDRMYKRGKEITGIEGVCVYTPELEDLDKDAYETFCLEPSGELVWPRKDEDEDEDEDDDILDGKNAHDEKGKGVGDPEQKKQFEKELIETLHRGMKGNLSVESVVLEAGTVKLTYHSLVEEYYTAAWTAFFSLIEPKTVEGKVAPKTSVNHLLKLLNKWKPVLAKFAKETDDQKRMLEGLTVCCGREPNFLPFAALMFNWLYNADLLEEDAALDWEKEAIKHPSEANAKMLKCAEGFLTFLKDSGEESDED